MAPQGDWESEQLKGKLMSIKFIAIAGIRGLFTTRYYQLKSIYFAPPEVSLMGVNAPSTCEF